MNNELMFSSASDDWSTPQALFDALNRVFRFDIDVCATPDNAKCRTFYTQAEDGLSMHWVGNVWMNPPYGREIGKWVAKAHQSAIENSATVVSLLPARVDTRWWHDHCAKADVYFIKGRLKFGNAKNSAPFPSAIVTFRPDVRTAMDAMS